MDRGDFYKDKEVKKYLRQISKRCSIYCTFTEASKYIIKNGLYEILSFTPIKNPYVSIIIPFFRSHDTILEVISNLLKLKMNIPCEIILIDDGSSDNTSEIIVNLYKDKVTLLKLRTNFGPAVARNIGAKFAKGKILFFLDSDQYICNSSIFEEIIGYTDSSTVISYLVCKESGEAITWPLKFPNFISWSLSLFLPRRFYKGLVGNIPPAGGIAPSDWAGINFVIEKNIFTFFEERYYGEDIDIFKRLNMQGIRHIFINKCPVIIFNRGIRPKSRVNKARYTLFQAKIVYARKYFPKVQKELFLFILFMWALIISLRELITYSPNNFFKARFFYRLGAFDLHKLWFW